MPFNSLQFLVFLAIMYALYWAMIRLPRARLFLLLIGSYAFYGAWNGYYVFLILLSTGIDYVTGGLIERWREHPGRTKALLVTSIVTNLSILCYFKYANFFIDNTRDVLAYFGYNPDLPYVDVILPVGISFYTFQSLSYTIDVYKGVLKPRKSPRDFFLFVAFFPQLVAGPIVRAREFLPQLNETPKLDQEDFAEAAHRLMRGLVKKIVIADYLAARVVDPVFHAPADFNSVETFVALVAFHFQVYCDFSGYTDIALGAARLFGFKMPDNFDTPYAAHTPSDYWRRWHMTLSRFCFDYIYAPLGGSKGGRLRTYLNNFITFGVIGFWHGANWNYVLFGVYHACGVILSRTVIEVIGLITRRSRREVEMGLTGNPVAIILTNLVIIFSLPLFRSPDMAMCGEVYGRVFALDMGGVGLSALSAAVLLVAIVTHFIPWGFERRIIDAFGRLGPVPQSICAFLLLVTVQQLATWTQRTFVYFAF